MSNDEKSHAEMALDDLAESCRSLPYGALAEVREQLLAQYRSAKAEAEAARARESARRPGKVVSGGKVGTDRRADALRYKCLAGVIDKLLALMTYLDFDLEESVSLLDEKGGDRRE